jgi:DNA-binding GntR family transcriptional regulator
MIDALDLSMILSCYAVAVKTPASSSQSRVNAVVTQLRQDIFEGRYPPGLPLRELTLARELSVSQATIREALQRLEHAGLVTRKPNIGSTVTRLSPKDIREHVELRTMLEVKAAQDASTRMGAAEFEELERRLADLEAAVKSDRYYEASQADLQFHRYIWQCSGNETLCKHLDLVTIPLFAFVSILRSQGLERLVAVVEAHTPLVSALRGGDPDRIRAEFEKGATSAYGAFLTGGPRSAVVAAFGFLEQAVK